MRDKPVTVHPRCAPHASAPRNDASLYFLSASTDIPCKHERQARRCEGGAGRCRKPATREKRSHCTCCCTAQERRDEATSSEEDPRNRIKNIRRPAGGSRRVRAMLTDRDTGGNAILSTVTKRVASLERDKKRGRGGEEVRTMHQCRSDLAVTSHSRGTTTTVAAAKDPRVGHTAATTASTIHLSCRDKTKRIRCTYSVFLLPPVCTSKERGNKPLPCHNAASSSETNGRIGA